MLIIFNRGGISHIPDILSRISDGGGWIPCDFESRADIDPELFKNLQAHSQEEYEIIWQSCIGDLVGPATSILSAMNDGLEHAALQLEIIPRPGTKNLFWMPGSKRTVKTDLEAEGEVIKPGDPHFSRILEAQLNEFAVRKGEVLTAWANSKGLSESQVEDLKSLGELDVDEDPANGTIRRDRQQLYLLLYIQHMVSRKSGGNANVATRKPQLTRSNSFIPPAFPYLNFPSFPTSSWLKGYLRDVV